MKGESHKRKGLCTELDNITLVSLCGILTLLTESSYKSVVLRGIVTKNYPHSIT